MRALLLILLSAFCFKSYGLINASATASNTSGCAPLIVNFTNLSTSSYTITSWNYNFGDGGSSSISDPKYTFANAGKYRVVLTITDAGGGVDTDTINIVVKKSPIADFSIPQPNYCLKELVPFKNLCILGDTGLRTCTWDFGDGLTSGSKVDFYKQYNKAGTFNVILTVKDYNGCGHTVTKNAFITITTAPKADFEFNQKYSCTGPMNVNFVNKSTRGSSAYTWNFGDGTTSAVASPSMSYGVAGNYTITLTAFSANGCKDVKTSVLNVKFGSIKADFSVASSAGCIPFDPQLTSTTTPDSVVFDYAWNFGDNSTSTLEKPTKTFNKIGTYNIKLKVSGVGCSDSITRTIIVSERPKAILKTLDTLSCDGALYSKFEAPVKLGKTWTWFIDGQNFETTKGVLSYQFDDTGIYKVLVQIDDSIGCSETFMFPKIAVQKLEASFELKDSGGCVPFIPVITNTTNSALNSNYTYKWVKHDGVTTAVTNPKFTYADTGIYKLKLFVKDKYGCIDSAKALIFAGMKIKPDFKFDKTRVCIDEPVKFYNTTSKNLMKIVSRWSWVLGENMSSNRDSVKVKFKQKLGYIQQLRLVSFHKGCLDTMTKDSAIYLKGPNAAFAYTFDTCYNNSVTIENLSDSFTSLDWNISGVGKKANLTKFTYKADRNSENEVILIAHNSRTTCSDTFKIKFKVPGPVSLISAKFVPNCTPQMVYFFNGYPGAARQHWDFGNGDTSNANPGGIGDTVYYAYNTPGTFMPKLKAWNSYGCLYESSDTITIKGPTVVSKVWPLKGCLPLTINLKDSNSNTALKKKYWLVNGDTVKATNANGIIQYTIKQMPFSGDTLVQVVLVAEDSISGCTSRKFYGVRPYGPKAEVFVTSKVKCDAMQYNMIADVDSLSTALPANITWVMGDGKSYNGPISIQHVYEKAGYYKPKIYLTDAAGCKFEKEMFVYATQPALLAKFSIVNNNIQCPPLLAEFKDSSKYSEFPITDYIWDLGGGYVSYEQYPSKLFTQPGSFDISLTIKNVNGCSSTYTIKDGVKIGGPVANYSVLNKKGCAPLEVEFKLNSKGLVSAEWDFGTGVVSNTANIKKRYADSGTYYPKLILKDSLNCQYIVLTKDTIMVAVRPKALFNVNTYCKDAVVDFKNLSVSNLINPALKYKWLVNTHASTLLNYSEKFNAIGSYNAQLIAENIKGCADTLNQNITISKPKADFKVVKHKFCLGDSLQVINNSSSAIGSVNHFWYSNAQFISNNKAPSYYPRVGDEQLKLIVFDNNNCSDTLKDNVYMHTADTQLVGLIQIDNASLLNGNAEIIFTPGTDIDFSHYTLYRENQNAWLPVKTDNDPLATLFNVDVKNYPLQSHCFKITQSNYCGAESELVRSKPHCTVHVNASPAVNSNIVDWNAYVGWPVSSYLLLRQNIKNAWMNDTLAVLKGDVLNYIDTTVKCTINHSYQVVAIGDQKVQLSYSDTAKAQAIWTNTIPEPILASATVVDNKNTEVQWLLSSTYKRSNYVDVLTYLPNGKIRSSNWEDANIELSGVDVQNHSYTYYIKVTDDCGDTSSASGIGKTVLLKPSAMAQYAPPAFHWTAYQKWPEGVAYYEVLRLSEQNTFDLVSTTTDTFFVDIFSPTNGVKQYQYRIRAVKKSTSSISDFEAESISNDLMIVPNSVIYMPNAFSPDNNGINDQFVPQGLYVYDYLFEVYNIWGELVFSTTDCMKGWDGYYKDEVCQQGVYYYKVTARGNDYKRYILKGNVTLLR
ncbi:MAG: PKD domain-containing protein [Bacteroidota bacterium]